MSIMEFIFPKSGYNLHNYVRHYCSTDPRKRGIYMGFFCWEDQYID